MTAVEAQSRESVSCLHFELAPAKWYSHCFSALLGLDCSCLSKQSIAFWHMKYSVLLEVVQNCQQLIDGSYTLYIVSAGTLFDSFT